VTACVDQHGLGGPGDRGAARARQEGAGLELGADPDRFRLAGLAAIGDVDVVVTGHQAGAGVAADGDVVSAGGVRVERLGAEGGVVLASGGGAKRAVPGRDVVARSHGVGEGAAAEREVLIAGRVVVAIGWLSLLVIANDPSRPDFDLAGTPLAPMFTQIRPFAGPINWPPEFVLNGPREVDAIGDLVAAL
jgi:hypothetical protein